jgi:hypothetical protein
MGTLMHVYIHRDLRGCCAAVIGLASLAQTCSCCCSLCDSFVMIPCVLKRASRSTCCRWLELMLVRHFVGICVFIVRYTKLQ